MSAVSREAIEGLGSPFASKVEWHEEIDSTQRRARELAKRYPGAPHGTLVVSGSQTGGRGRHGQPWASPPGGLWMSLVLRPERLPAAHAPRVMQATAVGVACALRSLGVDARLKWPNDVLVGCRAKICGILAEASLKEGNTDYVVLGIGLNANFDPKDLEKFTNRPVATVSSELGRDADLLELLDSILRHLDAALSQLTDDFFPNIMRERRTLECTLGERVSVRRSDETLTGRVVDLSPEGALVLETGRGVVELFEGEVERLRKE